MITPKEAIGMAEIKRPPGFMIYEEARNMTLYMPEESLGRVMKAAFDYFDDMKEPQEAASFSKAERKIFDQLKKDANKTWAAYVERCEANKKRAEKRWENEREKNTLLN